MNAGTCKHCGADEGLHQWETMRCPRNGIEAPVGKKQEWLSTTFEEYVDINAMIAAAVQQEREVNATIIHSMAEGYRFVGSESMDKIAEALDEAAAAIRARNGAQEQAK